MNEKSKLKEDTADALYKTVDGKGLRSFADGVSMNGWIVDGHNTVSAGDYIKSIKVRAAVLPNKLRASRGFPIKKQSVALDAGLQNHSAT